MTWPTKRRQKSPLGNHWPHVLTTTFLINRYGWVGKGRGTESTGSLKLGDSSKSGRRCFPCANCFRATRSAVARTKVGIPRLGVRSVTRHPGPRLQFHFRSSCGAGSWVIHYPYKQVFSAIINIEDLETAIIQQKPSFNAYYRIDPFKINASAQISTPSSSN